MDVIYTDCRGVDHTYNTTIKFRMDQEGVPWTNYWHLDEGDILVHLNYEAKNTHSLMIRQWCWRQGWNKIGQIQFGTVPDERYTNRALAFKFYAGDEAEKAAILFKMRWG